MMNELLKKGFLLGLGAAVIGKEKLESKLKELVDKNELTSEEAKEVMYNFIEKVEMKKEAWETKQTVKAEEKAKSSGLATKEDIREIHERINTLEKKWFGK